MLKRATRPFIQHPGDLTLNLPTMPPRTESATARSVSRRVFMAGTLGSGALLYTDQKIGEQIWGGTNPRIVNYSVQNIHAFPNTSWLILPGFGVSYPQRIGG